MSETEERTFTLGRRRRRRVSLALWVAEGSGRIRSTLEKPVACCPTNTNESLWVAWSWDVGETARAESLKAQGVGGNPVCVVCWREYHGIQEQDMW